MKRSAICLMCGLYAVTLSAAHNVSVTHQESYPGTDWGAYYRVSNNLVSVALFPEIGGRAMEFKLGDQEFLRTNKDAQKAAGGEHDFFEGGGFMTWPVPQDDWGAVWGGWPPPPALNHGSYTSAPLHQSADSVALFFSSPREQITSAAGLVFRKHYTLYKNASRMRIEHRMINESGVNQNWSVRKVVQHPYHRGVDNCFLYFPKGVSDMDGEQGYWHTEDEGLSTDFTEVAPGIMRVDVQTASGRYGAHPAQQWIAWVDKTTGKAFIQKADYDPAGVYPEYGGTVIILFIADTFLEAEPCSPEKNMAPGDSSVFVSTWYATTLNENPPLAVNNAGVLLSPLNHANGTLSGSYGVFAAGTARVMFAGSGEPAAQLPVSPHEVFSLNQQVAVPAGSGQVAVVLYDADGVLVDTLDTHQLADVPVAHARAPVQPLHRPRVVNGALECMLPAGGAVWVATLEGRIVMRADGLPGGLHRIALGGLASGTYTAVLTHQGRSTPFMFSLR